MEVPSLAISRDESDCTIEEGRDKSAVNPSYGRRRFRGRSGVPLLPDYGYFGSSVNYGQRLLPSSMNWEPEGRSDSYIYTLTNPEKPVSHRVNDVWITCAGM